MNKWIHKKCGSSREDHRERSESREESSSVPQEENPKGLQCLPIFVYLLIRTVQAFLILQPQALIISLSILVLLNSYLPFAYILWLALSWPICPSMSTWLLLILRNLSYPQIWCLSLHQSWYLEYSWKILPFPTDFPMIQEIFHPHLTRLILEQSSTEGRDSWIWKRDCLKYINVSLQKASTGCERWSCVSKCSLGHRFEKSEKKEKRGDRSVSQR